MFERFTEQARQTVVLAQEEACALGHDYIGTEHLLLGLLREQGGVAAWTLESLQIAVERVRAEVVRIVGSGEEVTSGQMPFTPRAKKILELALHEALSLGHNYIGTEHILLGLVRENGGVAARILLDFSADPEKVRSEVIRRLSGPGADQSGPPASGAAKRRAALVATTMKVLGPRTPPGGYVIPRRRARRLVEDAIRRHDPRAEATLGPGAWDAMIAEILDANPDVEPGSS